MDRDIRIIKWLKEDEGERVGESKRVRASIFPQLVILPWIISTHRKGSEKNCCVTKTSVIKLATSWTSKEVKG